MGELVQVANYKHTPFDLNSKSHFGAKIDFLICDQMLNQGVWDLFFETDNDSPGKIWNLYFINCTITGNIKVANSDKRFDIHFFNCHFKNFALSSSDYDPVDLPIRQLFFNSCELVRCENLFCDMREVSFYFNDTLVQNCSFCGILHLNLLYMNSCELRSCRFREIRYDGPDKMSFTEISEISRTVFSNCEIENVNILGDLRISDCTFLSCSIVKSSVDICEIQNCIVENGRIKESDIAIETFSQTDLRGIEIVSVNFRGNIEGAKTLNLKIQSLSICSKE